MADSGDYFMVTASRLMHVCHPRPGGKRQPNRHAQSARHVIARRDCSAQRPNRPLCNRESQPKAAGTAFT